MNGEGRPCYILNRLFSRGTPLRVALMLQEWEVAVISLFRGVMNIRHDETFMKWCHFSLFSPSLINNSLPRLNPPSNQSYTQCMKCFQTSRRLPRTTKRLISIFYLFSSKRFCTNINSFSHWLKSLRKYSMVYRKQPPSRQQAISLRC